MIRKVFKSFIPFLVLLTGIFILVIYLDLYAQQISVAPEIISIANTASVESEDIMQFELDEKEAIRAESQLQSDSLFQKAKTLYKAGDYRQSSHLFQQLNLIYNDAAIDNYLGLIALKENKLGVAQKHFQAAVNANPEFQTAHINLAVASSRMHQYRKAEEVYRKAIEINPANSKPYYNLGLLLQGLEQWVLAAAELEKSIELSSGDDKARSLCYYGISQLNVGDTIQARESFTKSIEYKPKYQLPRVYLALTSADINQREDELVKVYRLNKNSYYANYYLGKLYGERKQNSRAEYHLRKALEINPEDEKIIEELSAFLMQQERFDEAQLIIAGFSLHDTLPQTYFHEAKLASKKGFLDDAIKLYDLAIEKSGANYPKAALNQAVLYKQMKQTDKAIASYKAAIAMKEDYATAYYNLALLYNEIGNKHKTIESYQKAIEYDPNSSKSWYNLASIFEEQEKYTNAVGAYQKAIKADPKYLKALSALGVLYSKLNQYDKAIETYGVLVSYYPNYARGFYNMAVAYNKSQQIDKAIEAYAKVIAIDPQNIKAKKNVGVLYARQGNIDMAIKIFEDAVDEDLQNPELRLNLGIQYEKAEMFSQAAYQYTKSIQLDKDYKKAYDRLSGLYRKTNDLANSSIVRYKWLKQYPDGGKLYSVGKKLLKQGEFDYALSALELAGENGADANWTTYWTGMVYMKMSKYDVAIERFEEVIEKDPKHKFAFYRLGQTYELQGVNDKANVYYQHLLNLDPDFQIASLSNDNG